MEVRVGDEGGETYAGFGAEAMRAEDRVGSGLDVV